jgi:hypothetical protein
MAHQPGEGRVIATRRHETARRVTFAQVDDRLGQWQMAGITILTPVGATNVADMASQLRGPRPDAGVPCADARGPTTMVPRWRMHPC